MESFLQSYFCLLKYIALAAIQCYLLCYSCSPLVLFLLLLYLVLDSLESRLMK